MSAVDRLTTALLVAAARRWPADLREVRLQEWTAEVHALRGRPFGALRFALSLACSPAVEDGNRAVIGWREQLPGLGRAFQAVLALLAVGAAAPRLVEGVSRVASELMPDSAGPVRKGAVDLCALVILVVVAGWLGRRMGAALPFGGRARAAVATAAMLLAGFGLHLGNLADGLGRDGAPAGIVMSPRTVVTWALELSLLVVAYVAVRLAMRGRVRWAVAAAVAGTIGVLDALGVVTSVRSGLGLGWLATDSPLPPLAFAFSSDSMAARLAFRSIDLALAGYTVRALAVPAAFALAFGLTAARSRVTSTVVTSVAVEPGPVSAPVRWASWLGLGAAAAGVLTWAAAIALVTPLQRATRPVMDSTYVMTVQSFQDMVPMLMEEMHVPLLEQQLAAILLATLGVVVFLAQRGPVLLPGTAFAVALVTADVLLARYEIGGAPTFVGALLGGALAVVGAAALSAALGQARPDVRSLRRVLIGASVLAALCAPTPYLAGFMWSSVDVVSGYRAMAVLLALLLTALAAAAALAARTERPTPWLVIIAVVAPAAGMVAFAVLFLHRSDWTLVALAGAPLLAVLTLAGAAWTSAGPAGRWFGLGAGAVILGAPLAYVQVFAAMALSSGLVGAANYTRGSDSMPYLLGALAVALPLAAIAASRAVPRLPTVAVADAAHSAVLTPQPLPEMG